MNSTPTSSEIQSLFNNSNPTEVWHKAADIVRRINPAYDFHLTQAIFDDTVRLFQGEYPGYHPIRTLYHDLPHTLDVFLCAVRLMHGVHISGTRLTDDEMTMIMVAALMHDIGYAQQHGDETGTGAQYTQNHVSRGIEFMQRYLAEQHFPADLMAPLKFMMLGTDHALAMAEIEFPDERIRLLGQIVSTADLTGQMADRTYLEKLLFLYLEFKEANIGNYRNIHDLLCRTAEFYKNARQSLDGELGGIYTKLPLHFKDWMGAERNYYIESIENNMAYLSSVTSLDEDEYLSMLKRGGVAEKIANMVEPGRPE